MTAEEEEEGSSGPRRLRTRSGETLKLNPKEAKIIYGPHPPSLIKESLLLCQEKKTFYLVVDYKRNDVWSFVHENTETHRDTDALLRDIPHLLFMLSTQNYYLLSNLNIIFKQ